MDKNYWNNFYKKTKNAPKRPSNFALSILSFLEPNKKILELGCGNGRDSIFFYKKRLIVTAIDQAENSINILKGKYPNINFIIDDFVNSKYLKENEYDYIYSRFSLHAINKDEELVLLKKAYKSLKKEGKLFIETRSIKDNLYGLGDKVGINEYIYNNHYRRFIDIRDLKKRLKTIGYKIELCKESNGFAIYKNEDPIVIRIIASK